MRSNTKKKPQLPPKAKRKPSRSSGSERVPLAELKVHLSRYVREVQEGGRAITITQHGRDTAVLAPVKSAAGALPPLHIRPALDPRALGDIIAPRPKGKGITAEDIQRALDEEREDRV